MKPSFANVPAPVRFALGCVVGSLLACSSETADSGVKNDTGAGGTATTASGSGGAATGGSSSTSVSSSGSATTVGASTVGASSSSATTSSDSTSATSGSGGSGGADPHQLCVDTVNQYRSMVGLPPYARWTADESCVDSQAQADAMAMMVHTTYTQCGELAANECAGWAGPVDSMIGPCLQQMWSEGPGSDFNLHGDYINMTSTQYTKVACGFYTLPSGSVWGLLDFGL